MAAVMCADGTRIENPGSPPIRFFYSHLHESIRGELGALSRLTLELVPESDDVVARLSRVEQRCRFLEQIHKYHSVAEDEVVYPALDSKVKNVTQAYSVEHADEVKLFDQLKQLLSTALEQAGAGMAVSVREVVCKVEQVSFTLRKHLAKEEQQLFPLLLQHFNYVEQAELVAQFLCCIPVAAVETVMAWLKPVVPPEEQVQLVKHMRAAISDALLLQLLVMWLEPVKTPITPATSTIPSQIPVITDELDQSPIRQIVHVHRSIEQELTSFVREARSLLSVEPSAAQLTSLLEKHRFICGVCWFHMLSEEEVMFPELGRRNIRHTCSTLSCQAEHRDEVGWFDNLGRLLADFKSSARRGANEASTLLRQMIGCAEDVCVNLCRHMEREEIEVFPLLQENLCFAEQCMILWRTMRMMPLRLLERVMPWLVGQLSEVDASDLLTALRIGAEGVDIDSAAVELLSRWAQRGCVGSPQASDPASTEDQCFYPSDTCEPKTMKDIVPTEKEGPRMKRRKVLKGNTAAIPEIQDGQPETPSAMSMDGSSIGNDQPLRPGPKPIDHIFQFHRALKRDFRAFEAEVSAFVHIFDLEDKEPKVWEQTMQKLDGTFRFLWSIYRAHSKIEDEVVFPALECKKQLVNVCHSYVMDHKQEEALFQEMELMLSRMRSEENAERLQQLALQLNCKCAVIRAALETHVRGEENELWPLFVEHFTEEEQHELVGSVIGRTGAEVLQTMLPWVSGCFTGEEMDAMKESLKTAARNTMFDQWLDAVGNPIGLNAGCEQSGKDKADGHSEEPLVDLEQYLKRNLPNTRSAGEPSGSVEECSEFCPSWEDLFRMNQKQLEAAVRHVSRDETLKPSCKSYLIQRIMVSKYIVAQQQRNWKKDTPDQVRSHEGGLSTRVDSQSSDFHRTFQDEKREVLGCPHYQRKCALVAPCCSQIFTCRLCHDEKCDHTLPRFLIESMVCMVCGKKQPVNPACCGCGISMARYYCSICHLFDDDPHRDIYHCPFCNVCRRGKGLGSDFFHCMECNACMHMSLFKRHRCRQKCIEGNCPICSDTLFDSWQSIKELPCGHFMHSSCFSEYTRWNYTCPICSKSMGDMSYYFQMLDSLLASDPMPPEFSGMMQRILCNDCGQTDEAPYHFVYHSCPKCHSYNTKVL